MGDVKHASKASPSLAGTFHTTIHSPLKSAGAEQWELGTHKGKPGLRCAPLPHTHTPRARARDRSRPSSGRYNMADGDTRFFPLRASKLLSGGKLATVYSTRHSSGTSHMGLERDGATDPIGATAQSLEVDWDANNAPADDAHGDATFGEVADADADQADALVNQDAPADGAAGEGEGGDGMGGEYERSGRHQASHGPKGGIPISRLAGSMEKAQAKRFTNGLHKFGITKWGMSDAPGYNGLTFLAHGPKHTNAHTNVHKGHAGSTAKKLGVHWNSHEREEEGAGHVAVAKPAKLH